jgi:hypothetical protein
VQAVRGLSLARPRAKTLGIVGKSVTVHDSPGLPASPQAQQTRLREAGAKWTVR